MRRPLSAAALFLVVIAAIRLGTGAGQRVPEGRIGTTQLEADGSLLVTGQVYQKEEQAIYLKSVVLSYANAQGQSNAESQMQFQEENSIKEKKVSGNNSGESLTGNGIALSERLICETEMAPEIPLGSFVTLEGAFSPFSRATNPGEFDAAVYYRTLGIGGKLRKTAVLFVGDDYWRVRDGLYRFRCLLKGRLYEIYPEEKASVMAALLLGDKEDLDAGLKDLYKRNGILHILSISSLHITILGMGVYRLLRRVGVPIGPSAAAGSVLLLLFGCMTGFGVSACRAIGMYLIRMLGEMVGRTYDMLTALAVMAAVMVARNPYYLQNGGFLLSYTSVLGIGVVYPALLSGAGPTAGTMPEKLRKFCSQSILASISITLTTLPVQLLLYYEVPVYSVFLNFLVIPLMKPMMITGLLALVPGLGILAEIDSLILAVYEFLCGCFDRLPFHTWNPGCPGIWQVVLYYVLLLSVVMLRKYGKKKEKDLAPAAGNSGSRGWIRKALCAGTLSGAVLLLGIRPTAEDRATFLDVGQGDCILVQTASGEHYLFDCGSSSRSSVGKYVLLPYLKYNGIHTLDAVFLSHPDADHVNGVLELFETGGENGIMVKQLLLPAIEEEAREEVLGTLLQGAATARQAQGSPLLVGYLSAGDAWECGSAVFTCLHPEEGCSAGDANVYSECFLVEFKGKTSGGKKDPERAWSLLLTGDVESWGERELYGELAARKIGGINVLKAAHHGSRNSTSEELLMLLQPELTVISCGRDNRYGHPHAELLERLRNIDTYVLQTARSGAITITLRNGRLTVSTMVKTATTPT